MPPARITADQITALLQGKLLGSPDLVIEGAAGLTDATPSDISLLNNDAALKEAASSRAGLLLTHRPVPELNCAQIVVPHPALAMAKVVQEFFAGKSVPFGISNLAHRGRNVTLGDGVSIWPFVTLDDGVSIGRNTHLYSGVFVGRGSSIGENCVIYPNVTVREGVTIGNRVILHPGAVIGSDGFGYIQAGGRHHKIPQIGTVMIEDDVELGANVTVDRATFGKTIIRRGTKVDNLVQIAHNVEIGEHNIVVAQVGVAGSSKTGHHVMIGGQAGIADHVTVGDQVMIAARAGLTQDVPAQEIVAGFPSMPHKAWLKAMAIVAKLPELRQQVRVMEERLKALEENAAAKPTASRKQNVKPRRKR